MLSTPQTTTLQRKKSLPDVAGMPRMSDGAGMCREEVSMLGSARREEVRRMHEETEKLRANPLLYLVSPQVKVSAACVKIFSLHSKDCTQATFSFRSTLRYYPRSTLRYYPRSSYLVTFVHGHKLYYVLIHRTSTKLSLT